MGQACCRRPGPDSSYGKGTPPWGLPADFDHIVEEPFVESEDSRIRDALLYDDQPPVPVFRDQAANEGLCSPTGCLVRCLTFCCCCSLLLPLMAYLLLVQTNFSVYGTTFTYFNYYRPVWNYLLARMADTVSLTEWYSGLTEGDPFLGEGPGPNTFMYYGWSEVRSLLRDMGPRIRNGTLKRYNELGITIQNSVMWPEIGTIVLGYSNAAHAIVRPLLAGALDGARRPNQACDGSTCWNAAWLRSVFREQFANMDALSSKDLKWIVTRVLHKIHLNLDITDEDAKKFAVWMTLFLLPQPLPEVLATSWPVDWLMNTNGILDFKSVLIERYKSAIRLKWPMEGWDSREGDLELLASAMVDSLALAGGLSVPTALDFMLALLFMKDSPAAPLQTSELVDATVLHDFMLETLRRFPPVSGVPHWITNDGGETWVHHVPNVGQALQDPRVFPRPLEFVPGRPGLNHKDQNLSIGWADFALVRDIADPDSHVCPGKQLSMQIMAAFLSEFIAAGPWKAEDDDIKLSTLSSSGFVLRKSHGVNAVGRSDDAGEFVPLAQSFADPFPSVPELPLLRLCHWMPSICRALGVDLHCVENPCAFR